MNTQIQNSQPVCWGKNQEFPRNDPQQDIFRKWHYHLKNKIMLLGDSKRKPNGHGNYWSLLLGKWDFWMDDYNCSIHINEKHIGGDFGGFHTYVTLQTYKYFVGLLYQEWLKKHCQNP